jgi:hypothetical protein
LTLIRGLKRENDLIDEVTTALARSRNDVFSRELGVRREGPAAEQEPCHERALEKFGFAHSSRL